MSFHQRALSDTRTSGPGVLLYGDGPQSRCKYFTAINNWWWSMAILSGTLQRCRCIFRGFFAFKLRMHHVAVAERIYQSVFYSTAHSFSCMHTLSFYRQPYDPTFS